MIRYHDSDSSGHAPKREPFCNCGKPLYISIPPEGHIHLMCPVHGEKVVYGSGARHLTS